MEKVKTYDAVVSQLIDDATNICGSLAELSRRLQWAHGNVLRAKRTGVAPPWRISQLCAIAGDDPTTGALYALLSQAKSDEEKQYWSKLFNDRFMEFELLKLSRIARTARARASQESEKAHELLQAAKAAESTIEEARLAGVKMPSSMR